MHFVKVEKGQQGTSLSLYNENLQTLESEAFADLYTLNFHLQTLASKYKIGEALMVIHDRDSNRVELSLVRDESLFFVS